MNYYDDRFGFSTPALAHQECEIVVEMSKFLGIGLSDKTQCGVNINLLGINLDFHSGALGILPERRSDLISILFDIITTMSLTAGEVVQGVL